MLGNMFANLLEPLFSSIIFAPKAYYKTNKRIDEGNHQEKEE
jgi:hypothetical protein